MILEVHGIESWLLIHEVNLFDLVIFVVVESVFHIDDLVQWGWAHWEHRVAGVHDWLTLVIDKLVARKEAAESLVGVHVWKAEH